MRRSEKVKSTLNSIQEFLAGGGIESTYSTEVSTLWEDITAVVDEVVCDGGGEGET